MTKAKYVRHAGFWCPAYIEHVNHLGPIRKTFLCLDCGQSCLFERYMVHNDLWRTAIGPGRGTRGMLCIGCLEDRLGRRLTPEDFTDCPLNTDPMDDFERSCRLMNRMGRDDEFEIWMNAA